MLHYPNETKKDIKKHLVLFMAGACVILYAIYITLAWLYTQASTNVLFMDGWLPFIMRLVLELIDVAVFASAYFCIIYAFFRMSPKKALLFPVFYIALTLFRRAMSLLIEFITSGYIGSEDLLSLGLYYFFDIIQLIIVVLIVAYEARKCSRFINEYKQAGLDAPKFLPFTSVFNKNNPLQTCSFKLAIMISGIKIVTRIISDLYYGAPESLAEGLIMLAYYSADLLNGVIFYTILWFLFSHINKKETALLNNKAESMP
jgi:hypothetical protein